MGFISIEASLSFYAVDTRSTVYIYTEENFELCIWHISVKVCWLFDYFAPDTLMFDTQRSASTRKVPRYIFTGSNEYNVPTDYVVELT